MNSVLSCLLFWSSVPFPSVPVSLFSFLGYCLCHCLFLLCYVLVSHVSSFFFFFRCSITVFIAMCFLCSLSVVIYISRGLCFPYVSSCDLLSTLDCSVLTPSSSCVLTTHSSVRNGPILYVTTFYLTVIHQHNKLF